jgi:phage-related protein
VKSLYFVPGQNEWQSLKPLIWVGSSRNNLRKFPGPVQDHTGYALYIAQRGGKHRDTKALSGFDGAGVLEVTTDFRGDTFRAVYTVRYSAAVYVLHAFQKKSRKGRQTPRREIELIRKRLSEADQIAKEAEQ